MNVFDDTRAAVEAARAQLRAADDSANAMANVLRGRLRHVSRWNLEALKKELRNFNSKTGRWNQP